MRNTIKPFFALALFLVLTAAHAAPIVWNGPATTNTANNWSSPGNWQGGVLPATTDDIKFFDLGAVPGTVPNITNINNTVDVNTTNGWVLYGNTNGFHTTFVSDGVTLTIMSNLDVGTLVADTTPRTPYASITGVNGTVIVNNTNSYLAAKQGGVAGTRATLDMTGLGTLQATVKSLHIGTTGISPNQAPGSTTFETGTLLLARTNVITAVFTPAAFISGAESLEIGYNGASSAGGQNFLYLGLTNSINVPGIRVGGTKGTAATMAFNPAFTNQNPVAVFRGPTGGTSRVSYWASGDMGQRGSSSGAVPGTNDFTFGSVDAMVDQLILGQDPVSTDATAVTTANPSTGVLKFNSGIINANTVILGNQQTSNPHQNTSPLVGKIFINGNATLVINTILKIPFTFTNAAAGLNSFGLLNVTNGTVLANSITVGSNSISPANAISLTNATLIVSNALATATSPLTNYFSANSLLGLKITSDASTKAFFGILTTGGSTNLVQIDQTPVFFGSYPAQIALIKYSFLVGAGYNFGLTNIPAWAVGAYLSNNTTAKSVDLVLPSDPRPVISIQPAGFSGSPGDNVTFSVTAGGVGPLSYQWYTNGVAIADGPTGHGSSNFGSATATLGLTNAQNADSVSTPGYTVIVTNVYGAATSSPAVLTISAGDTAPVITGPANVTAIQGNNATFTVTVTGNPAPALQWQTNGTDIPGATFSSVTVNNVQYPADDQTVFSLIATNRAGKATNFATLTVIVPPVIIQQPVNVVVTNTQAASFTVVAAGVPALGYKWSKNGNPLTDGGNISGSSTATLSFAAASPVDINTYSVTITNAAGTTNSISVSLTVNSTMGITALSPANGATGICYDTPLYATFSSTPVLRNAGKIRIYNITNNTTPVDTLDMSANSTITQIGTGTAGYPVKVQPRTISGATYITFPVIITNNTAAIYPHEGVMTSNQTYYVTIDNGVFTETNGAYFVGLSDTNAWQFTTKLVGPPAGTNIVVVSTDGTADFCTVQGAVDFFPNFTNTTAFNRVIYLRKGNYVEIVRIPVGKNNITLRGESRQDSWLSYPNSNLINASSHTVMVLHVLANDIAIENLKLTNSVPQGGSQSFALMVETGAKRFICNNADVDSYQDTILVNTSDSTAYFYKTLIQGDVDFIWGGGNCFFTNCEMRELRTGGIYFQPRTDPNSNGMAVVRCQLKRYNGTNASGSNFTNCLFARALGNANSSVALLYCNIDTNAVQIGWTASDLSSLTLRWWEYGNSNLDNTAPAVYNGTQLTGSDPRLLAAQDATTWLVGWVPQLAPNILGHPANQSVAGGGTASFNVTATGIPDPTYQWTKNGTNIPNATNVTLVITPASLNDAGTFAAVVTTPAGSVTSSNAVLTVGNTAPALTPVSDQAINVGVTVNVTNVATDPDVPAQTLAFSLLTGPTGSTVDPASGVFNWRPTVSQANSVNPISVVVADGGSPNLSATNTFTLTVNPLNQPAVSADSLIGGVFSLTASGDFGPDYALQVSTNLANWDTLLITNSPLSPFTLVDTNSTTTYPMRFYRLKVGPPLP